MKKILIVCCSFLIFVMLLLILYTNQGRSIRQKELDNAVTSSLEKTMTMLSAEGSLRPSTNDELVALFMEALVVQIDSSSNLVVHVLAADVDKGLLSVEAILEYMHPIGTIGRVSCTRTIMLEQYEIDGNIGDFTIQFIVEGALYKSYNLKEGVSYMIPATPVVSGKTFAGWKDMATGSIVNLNGKKVTENATYVAVFN